VTIDNALLYKYALKLSEYDFASEVDVNILGHIFENSLNELDEVQAQLDGREIDKTKTKRKKDGVFYTPKYITKYIVENTIGKLCTEKKTELLFFEEDYTTDRKRQTKTKQALLEKLKTYQNWLLQLTICDPACGSGAFLNQALDFLMNEHRYIDELQAKLLGVPMVLSDVEKSILENNLFGVDLNEESVEIAKLSLWLRTAQPNRKLNDLSNNIKCGNSLISDPAVAGEKAFDWEREFPRVFGRVKSTITTVEAPKDEKHEYLKLIKEKSFEAQTKAEQAIALSKEAAEISKKVYEYAEKLEAISESDSPYSSQKRGFDVVIGNPPYVRIQNLSKNEIDYYFNTYNFPSGKLDISILFFEKALEIISATGIVSFISSSQWLQTDYGKNIRDKFSQGQLLKLIDFGSLPVFEDADTYPAIFIFSKQKTNKLQYALISDIDNFIDFGTQRWNAIEMISLGKDSWNFNSLNIIGSLKSRNVPYVLLKDVASCNIGDLTGLDKAFVLSTKDASSYKIENEVLYEYAYRGEEVESYIYVNPKSKIIYPYFQDQDGKTVLINEYNFSKKYPNAYGYLLNFRNNLMDRIDSRKKYAFEDNWYRHLRQGNIDYYKPEKIIIKGIGTRLSAGLLGVNKIFNGANCPAIQMTDNSISIKYLLIILNSKLITFHLNSICPKKLGNYYRYNASNISDLPVMKMLPDGQQPFIEKADLMLSLTKELQEASQKFQRSIQRKFDLEDLPGKLQNWYLLSYKEFIGELGKKKVKLSLTEEAEWEDYFLQEVKKVLHIKAAIETTDKEIDQMVYQLYGLTDEEIKIVEGA
jgi:type I restriction-modification system DNA methylase subunit